MIYSNVLTKKKLVVNIFYLSVSFLFVGMAYIINSCCIKPQIVEINTFWQCCMVNYFNDFWAGIFIATFSNLMFILVKKRYIRNSIFYVALWIFVSLIWEVFRPFVLLVANPFNKTPKALWGDVVVYGMGILLFYIIITLLNSVLNRYYKDAS